MLDENLSWDDHIKIAQNKLAKNVGLLYHGKHFLDETSLNTLTFFSYVHSSELHKYCMGKYLLH